jgi:hypothetical protein
MDVQPAGDGVDDVGDDPVHGTSFEKEGTPYARVPCKVDTAIRAASFEARQTVVPLPGRASLFDGASASKGVAAII